MTEVLRADVLRGVRVLVAAPPGAASFAPAIEARTAALDATARRLEVDPAGEELGGEADVLVWDGSRAGTALAALDGAWLVVRPVAGAMTGGGLIVLVAPRPGDAQAEAARAGLETMARTLSIEWARLAIRPVAVLPGEATAAGAYFSGCRFELA